MSLLMSKLTNKETAIQIAEQFVSAQSGMFICLEGDVYLAKVQMRPNGFAAYHAFLFKKGTPQPSYEEVRQACACEGIEDITVVTKRFFQVMKELKQDGKLSVWKY